MITAELGPHSRGLFTTRAGGVSTGRYAQLNLGGAVGDEDSAVAQNRQILAEQVGAPVSFAHQEHGTRVHLPPPPGAPEQQGTGDAVLTTHRDHPVGVLVADCVPVLLSGPGAVVAVHAGRRGLLAGVIGAALRAMSNGGGPATHASIGPAICGRCYEVPEQMRTEAGRINAAVPARTSWGTPALDLPSGVTHELRLGGVQHIHRVELCTREDERFFSHRRDQLTGRFAAVVARR